MNPLNRQWFYRGFRKKLRAAFGRKTADVLWSEAGQPYVDILEENPLLRRHKGAMVLPAVALYRVLDQHGLESEKLLNAYGDDMGRRFAKLVHGYDCTARCVPADLAACGGHHGPHEQRKAGLQAPHRI